MDGNLDFMLPTPPSGIEHPIYAIGDNGSVQLDITCYSSLWLDNFHSYVFFAGFAVDRQYPAYIGCAAGINCCGSTGISSEDSIRFKMLYHFCILSLALEYYLSFFVFFFLGGGGGRGWR